MCGIKLSQTYRLSLVVLIFCCIFNENCQGRTYRRRYNPDIVHNASENGDLNNHKNVGLGSDTDLEYPGSFISDQVRNSLRLPRNSTRNVRVRVESSESESKSTRKRIPGLRRRRRPRPNIDGNGLNGDRERPTRRVPNLTRRKHRSSAENENIKSEIEVPNGSDELKLKVIPHPSFTNNGEPFPISSTYHRLDDDDQENISKSVTVNLKPAKKYYPVFRKSKSTTTPNPALESERTAADTVPFPEDIFLKKQSTKTKSSHQVTSKINPQLFSLRSVPDLDTHESINPFLEGAGSGSPVSISNDFGGKNLHSLHSLLNPESVYSDPAILTTEAPEVTTPTLSVADSSVTPTMADDLMMSDETPSTTQNNDSGESPSTVRYRKRLMESESIKTAATDLPTETTTTTTTTTATTTAGTAATEKAEITESSAPTGVTFSNLPDLLDSIVVTLEASPITTNPPQVPHSSTPITNQETTTTSQEAVPTSKETVPTTNPPTQQPTTSGSVDTIKVQRQIPTSSSNAVEQWSTPAPNPYDIGTILNRFLTPPPPTQAQPVPTPDLPILSGLIDSLNSISNYLDPQTASPPTNILTTSRPFFPTISPNIFGGGAIGGGGINGGPTEAPSLTQALSNMINVITNPFSEFGKVNNVNSGAPVSNLLSPITTTPKPVVPLNPTDYLSQLLQLSSDLGISQDAGANQGSKHETPRHALPSITVTAAPVPTPRPFLPLFSTSTPPLFDFSSLLSGNWLGGGGLFAATTPAPSLNLFSLLSGLNPFAALLTTSRPANLGFGSLFSGSATNQQPSIFGQPQQKLQSEKKSGPYFWFDMNTFLPGQNEKTSPTTGIRPKLGDKDYFFRVR